MNWFGLFGSFFSSTRPIQITPSGEAGNVARAHSKIAQVGHGVEDANERIDRLTIVCVALWKLLQERTDLTEADLLAKVREIDLADGREDGKISPTVKRCTKCGRVMSPRHARCLYCGAEKLNATAFDPTL